MRKILKIGTLSALISALVVFLSFSKEFREIVCILVGKCVVVNPNEVSKNPTTLPPSQEPQKEIESSKLEPSTTTPTTPATEPKTTEVEPTQSQQKQQPEKEVVEAEPAFKADIYVSPLGVDEQKENQSSNSTTDMAELHVSPIGADEPTGTLTADVSGIIVVSERGKDNNPGGRLFPFRSLTRAIKQAQVLQNGDTSKKVVIKLENGYYSESSGETREIVIPENIEIIGSGDKTIIQVGLKMSSKVKLEKLTVNATINIDNNDRNDSSININELTIEAGELKISSSPNLSNIKLVNSGIHVHYGKPNFVNVEGVKRLDTYYRSNVINIESPASANFKVLKLQENDVGIENRGNVYIEGLELVNQKVGIINDNNGSIFIKGLKISQISHTAICNSGNMVIQEAVFEKTNLIKNQTCIKANEPSPPVPIDLGGNYEKIKIE